MYRFPFYHAPGSFPMQNVPYFHPTLAELIKQDPGEFCLIDPIVQQVWFATAIAWPTLGQLKVGEKKMIDSWAEEQKTQYNKWPRRMKGCSKPMSRVVVMNIKPWLGWARNDPHKFYVNATVFLEKQHPGFTCIHLPISNTGWKRQTFVTVACW